MDIDRYQFAQEFFEIVNSIANSHFISFDLEFSGVARHRTDEQGKPDLQHVYSEIRTAATQFQVLQVGLTIAFEDRDTGSYELRPYNFTISPIPNVREDYFDRVWCSSGGATNFLLHHKFDFQSLLTHGIPYLSREEEETVRETWTKFDSKKVQIADLIWKDEDQPLIDHIRDASSQWIASGDSEKPMAFLNIPPDHPPEGVPASLNSYQKRLTHQIVKAEFPKLRTKGMRDFISVTKQLDDNEQAKQLAHMADRRNREIAYAVGFRWLMDSLVGRDISGIPTEYLNAIPPPEVEQLDDETPVQAYLRHIQEKLLCRQKILVGHNCFTDLVNFYACFFGTLPESVEQFVDSIHKLFPAVIDTKYLASFGQRWTATSLADLAESVHLRNVPKVDLAPNFHSYLLGEREHEAGYDSYLTAKVFIHLATELFNKHEFQPSNPKTASAFGVGLDSLAPVESATEPKTGTEDVVQSVTKSLSQGMDAMKKVIGGDASSLGEPSGDANGELVSGQTTGAEEMMPPWTDGGFWEVVGNKLQVNSSKERVCILG